MSGPDTSRISPTAHYTAATWEHLGLSHPALATRPGRFMFRLLRPINYAYDKVRGGPDLPATLERRHRVIDHLLATAIEDGRIGQVIEVAAGLSPRGLRFCERYPHLVYVEADLPAMAAHKRQRLEGSGLLSPRHHVTVVNALTDDGPHALDRATGELLDRGVGTAIVTEGLVNYFAPDLVRGMWARFARFLSGFPRGVYLSDIHLLRETMNRRMAQIFTALLQVVARGAMHFHFEEEQGCLSALRDAGFTSAAAHRPRDFEVAVGLAPVPRADLVRVIEAWVTGAQ